MCEDDMPSNLLINDSLMSEALRLGGHNTKRQTLNEALEEYIQRRKRLAVLRLFGKIQFDQSYDYKRGRRMR